MQRLSSWDVAPVSTPPPGRKGEAMESTAILSEGWLACSARAASSVSNAMTRTDGLDGLLDGAGERLRRSSLRAAPVRARGQDWSSAGMVLLIVSLAKRALPARESAWGALVSWVPIGCRRVISNVVGYLNGHGPGTASSGPP